LNTAARRQGDRSFTRRARGTAGSRWRGWTAWLGRAALLCGALGAHAQSADRLTLQEVLDAALESSVDIQIAASLVRFGQGELLVARSLFDPLVTMSGSRSRIPLPELSEAVTTQTGSALTLAMSQRLRSGVQLLPSISIEQLEVDRPTASATNVGTVSFRLVAPLLEDRGGKSGRLSEKAAEVALAGDQWNLHHQRAITAFQVGAAFWNYLAAQRRLEVFVLSQKRAELLVDEMQELVAEEERPAADLIQVEGNAAAKSSDRIAAEQTVSEARRQLGLIVGLAGSQIAGLPLPGDDFPTPTPFPTDPETVSALVEQALNRRADLEAAHRQEDSSRFLAEAAEDALKAKLDLSLTAGYSGIDAGLGIGDFLGGLNRNVPGLSAAVSLRYELPIANAAAEGSLAQSRSIADQRQLLREDVERTIRAAVPVAAEALRRAELQVAEAERAIALNHTTVENEIEKHRLGSATLIDVILAEDRLTSTQLAAVNAYLNYALALATLRFETGTLVEVDATIAVDADRFLRRPSPR